MQTRLFVGNLSWNVSEADLVDLAAPHGEVVDAKVITDRDTGRSRGFGFVTVETDNPQALIQALDGQELDGRAIRVNEAESRPERDRGGYGSGGRSSGRGGYGGGGRGGDGGGGRRDRY
jgi:RNA recognition motif-containing protein